MVMGKKMEVAVRMEQISVAVNMIMDKIHPQEQIEVTQYFLRGTLGYDRVPFIHDVSLIGDIFQDGQVMSGGNDGPAKGM